MSATSSSDEEDFSKFASCAVTAVQIEQTALVEAQKRRSTSSSSSRGGGAVTVAAAPKGHSGDASDHGPGMDGVSVKIAAALDAILARELDSSNSKRDTAPALMPIHNPACISAAAAASHEHPSPASNPVSSIAAAAGEGDDEAEEAIGVRLFRKVPQGTPCVLPQQPSTADTRHNDSSFLGERTDGTLFGSGSLPRKQPLRDQIPRLSLAEQSRQAGKRKHEQVLSALAVDGHALLAAAAAAGYAGAAGPPAAGKRGAGVANSSSTAGGGRNCISTTTAWVKAWKRLKGQKAPGVVVDAKEFVPYEVRTAKLLGTQLPPGLRS